jgi:hypothetical protein
MGGMRKILALLCAVIFLGAQTAIAACPDGSAGPVCNGDNGPTLTTHINNAFNGTTQINPNLGPGTTGGTGGATPGGSTNAVQYNAGSSTFGGVSLGVDQLLAGSATTPAALGISSCTPGLTYSSHAFGCLSSGFYLQSANNLSDITNPATAVANLGVGQMVLDPSANLNKRCTGNTTPFAFCTGVGTGSFTPAACNGSTDDTTAVQAAFTAACATGVRPTIHLPDLVQGSYGCLVSSPITLTCGAMLYGDGPDSGLLFGSRTQNGLVINTTAAVTVQNITFRGGGSGSAQTAGDCLQITSTSGENDRSVFIGNRFNSCWNSVHFVKAAYWKFIGNDDSNHINVGLLIENQNTGDSGDNAVIGNSFAAGTAPVAGIEWLSSGGTRIESNKVLGNDATSTLLNAGANVNTGNLFVDNNSIEGFTTNGILLETTATTALIEKAWIDGNEIAQNTGSPTSGITLSKNASSTLHAIHIADNIIVGPSSSMTGIVLGAATDVTVDINHFFNVLTGISQASGGSGALIFNYFGPSVTTNYSTIQSGTTISDSATVNASTEYYLNSLALAQISGGNLGLGEGFTTIFLNGTSTLNLGDAQLINAQGIMGGTFGIGLTGGGSLATGSNSFAGTITSAATSSNVFTPGFTCANDVVMTLSDRTHPGVAGVTAVSSTTATFSATSGDTVDYVAGCR